MPTSATAYLALVLARITLPVGPLPLRMHVRNRCTFACTSIVAPAQAPTAPSLPAIARAVIVGGGPAGLTTAIMLARRGWTDVHVIDRLAPPPEPDDAQVWSDTARFYLLGLGGRGQNALRSLGAWEAVSQYTTAVIGRKDWPPGAREDEGIERIFTDRTYPTQVIARDRLVGALHRLLRTQYAGKVHIHHGLQCTAVRWSDGGETASLEVRVGDVGSRRDAAAGPPEDLAEACPAGAARPTLRVTTAFLVGADGTARTVAMAMEAAARDFKVIRYKDDNPRVYKTVPLTLPPGWRGDVNYSARSKDGRVNFDALPASPTGDYLGVLLLRAGDPLASADTKPEDLRALLDAELPQFSKLLSDDLVERIAAKAPSRLPGFRTVRPRLHHGHCTLLLGDAVHTVKPYFGLGANSAFEDVIVLRDALDAAGVDSPPALPVAEGAASGTPGMSRAVREFSDRRAQEARALVRISRGFDRPGALGFVTFIVPIILDGIFHSALPRIFAPNTISLLQKEYFTFRAVARRKRLDRALQATLIAVTLAAASTAVCKIVRGMLASSHGRMALGVAATTAALAVARAALPLLFPRMGIASGDGVAKMSRPRDNDSILLQQRMTQPGYGKPTADGVASRD